MKVIAVKESIFSNNDKVADELRASLRKKGAFMINVMSSPGSGKTTLLTRLINDMKSKIRIVAMDVDIETDVDARRIAENTGVESVQIHNGGLCHIDADGHGRAGTGGFSGNRSYRAGKHRKPCVSGGIRHGRTP